MGISRIARQLGAIVAMFAPLWAQPATPALSGGSFYECSLSDAGAVSCWGDRGSGKLGTGEPLYSAAPITVGGQATSVTAIGASNNHTCALTSTGSVLCWGGNYFGELGNGTFVSSATPVPVKALTGVTAIAVSDHHNCALKGNGEVWCWGLNREGQLGNGKFDDGSSVPVRVQALVSPMKAMASISVGAQHTCAVSTTGEAFCWGSNVFGQLATGNYNDHSVAVAVSGITATVTSISAGLGHTCAVTTASNLLCWGDNYYRQLGDGTTVVDRTTPAAVPAMAGITASVSAGSWYTCGVTKAGTAGCWGTNFSGVLGTGAALNTIQGTPTPIPGFSSGVASISVARSHACALRNDTTVHCWGYNAYGGLGDGTTTDRALPVRVLGLANGATAVASGNLHTCAIGPDKRVSCWGYNGDGHLGGDTIVGRVTPAQVSGLGSGMTAISTGVSHSCALNAARGALCWGRNGQGELGNNSAVNSSAPVAVQGLTSGVQSLVVGGTHTCAINSGGAVMCWGDNSLGQLGNGPGAASRVPVAVAGLPTGIVGISAGWSHSCAVTGAGAVYCWGTDYYGALGNGAATFNKNPVQVTGMPAVKSLSSKLFHQCAVTNAGSVYCWGNNLDGQMGDGTNENSLYPYPVIGLPAPIASVSVGSYHTCAVTTSGGVWCWGYGLGGQLGDGFPESSNVPVQPVGMASGVVGLGMGSDSCAINDVGVVLCWGDSDFGQMGDGTYVSRAKPIVVLAPNGTGTLDANNWFLDLISTKAKAIASDLTPKILVLSQLSLQGQGSGLDATVKYKASEFGKNLNHYVFARVPPSFFSMVKTAPGSLTEAQLLAKSGKAFVFAQLTPYGWTNLQGQLLAYSQGTANAAGGAASIFNNVPLQNIPGARFCVGYGTSSTDMISGDTFREVLVVEGAASTVDNKACVLTGVYLDGPKGSRFGTPVTFVASVVGLSPTGTVQFYDGSVTLLSPVTLADSANQAVRQASITTASLAAGVHSIGASYSGDGNQNPAATAAILLHEVSIPSVSSQVELEGPRDSVLGSAVSFFATVTGNGPTGNVQFKDGTTNLGAPVALVGGAATLKVSSLTLGSHAVSAAYLGDGSNAASTSNTLAHNVYAARNTSVALTSSANPSAFAAAVTFTATVTGSNPTGQVVFREGSTTLATVALAGGSAAATITGLAAGSHLIEADYSGDGGNQAVTSSALLQEVTAPPATTAPNVFLVTATNPATVGQAVNFTTTVAGGSNAPTGTVTLMVGSAVLCTATLNAATASCSVGSLAAGLHLVTAVYSGDSRYAAASSSLVSQSIASVPKLLGATPASLDFGAQGINTSSQTLTVTLSNPTSAAIALGSVMLPAGVQAGTSTCTANLAAGASCQMGFAFRPAVVGSVAGSIVVTYTGGATLVPVVASGERSLVTHYYRSILGRVPDTAGKAYWESEAARVAGLGANINEAWFAMAMSFYGSAEYTAFNRGTTDYVRDLYNTFFNRSPDTAGSDYWAGQITQGMPREIALAGFMFSTEFVGFAQAIFGNTAARAEVDTVVDFYRGLLGRLPDSAGFNYWVGQFRTAQCAGATAVYTQVEAISSAYANSPEYSARNRTHAQYVGDLYNAFLRRGGDLAGVQFWIGQLATGAQTREQLRKAFLASPEFSARVSAVIAQGCKA